MLGVAGRVREVDDGNRTGVVVTSCSASATRDGQRKRIDDNGPQKDHQRLLGRVECQRFLAGHVDHHKRLQAVLVEEEGRADGCWTAGASQLDFAYRQSDEEVKDFGQGRVVDEEPTEELKAVCCC